MANTQKYQNPTIMQHQIEIKKLHKLDEIKFKRNISRTDLVNEILDKWFAKMNIKFKNL